MQRVVLYNIMNSWLHVRTYVQMCIIIYCYIFNIYVPICTYVVIAQEPKGPGTVIIHPARQDVELLCSVAILGTPQYGVTWIINFNHYGVSSLANGVLDGYSADIVNSNLIVKNIVMNDNRNNTEFRCVIIMSDRIVNDSDPIFLYVAGECSIACINYAQMFIHIRIS